MNAWTCTLGAVALAGCAAFHSEPLPAADPAFLAAAASSGLDPDSVARGREVYSTACIRCHTAVHPARRTASEWAGILPDMVRRAALTPPQRTDVRSYIDAVLASAPPPGGPPSR